MANEKNKPPAEPGQDVERRERDQRADPEKESTKEQPGDIGSSEGSKPQGS
jgi:hypothetical protein